MSRESISKKRRALIEYQEYLLDQAEEHEERKAALLAAGNTEGLQREKQRFGT